MCATCSRAATPGVTKRRTLRKPPRRSRNSPSRCARAARNSAAEGTMADLDRRTVIAASAAFAAMGGAARAQAPAARQKGPLVWLDMDQQELDDAYDQSKYAANLQQIVK